MTDRVPSLVFLVRSDLEALASLKGSSFRGALRLIDVLTLPGAWAGILVRVGTWLHDRRLRPLSRLVYFANTVLFSCEIQPGAMIGPSMAIPHPIAVGIAKEARVGSNVRLMAMVRVGGMATDDPSLDGYPTIGDDCWLLDGARVWGPVVLADRTVIASGATVLESFTEPDTILVGTPAVIGKRRAGVQVSVNE